MYFETLLYFVFCWNVEKNIDKEMNVLIKTTLIERDIENRLHSLILTVIFTDR